MVQFQDGCCVSPLFYVLFLTRTRFCLHIRELSVISFPECSQNLQCIGPIYAHRLTVASQGAPPPSTGICVVIFNYMTHNANLK